MNWAFIGLLTALTAAAQTPADTAQALNTQGNGLVESGNYPEAQRLYQESIRIFRSLGPAYEAHAASALLNLAIAMNGEGQRAAATKVLEEALAMHRHALGDRHLRTLTNMNLLANNHLMTGDPNRADAIFQQLLPVERELYPDDIQTARTLQGLSYGLVRQNQGREALPLAEEALRIAIQREGPDTMEAALAYSSVAEAHRSMGSGARALPLYRQARALYQKALGPDSPRVATLLSQEGLILMQDGKLALAEQSMKQSVQSLSKSCPGCLVELTIAQSNLGLLHLRQKRYREADEAYSAAIELREKLPASRGPELADALQSLAEVRQKEHKFEDAARLNTRAQMIRAYR
jgi:tetratricopeptide (TPR) repeat protein